ncbi:MAG: hypothetical protein GF317_06040 [Candidatus Lokiarchaeota archaeon]|nr:hypothetical protein [Candidatus Lokiarchaeota archaeon]
MVINKKLTGKQATFAALCDGKRTLTDIRQELKIDTLSSYLILKRLYNKGIIELRRKIEKPE